jgi:molybdenum cofactor cytidylyltransferase
VVDLLIATYKKRRAPVIAPTYHQIRGHPVIFSASLVPELLKVKGDVGGREVIRRHREELTEVEVEDGGIFKRMEIGQADTRRI